MNPFVIQIARVDGGSLPPSGIDRLGYPISAEDFEFDVYPLEPVGGVLCVWCEDVGKGDIAETTHWDTDEWVGYIPVHYLAWPSRVFTFLG